MLGAPAAPGIVRDATRFGEPGHPLAGVTVSIGINGTAEATTTTDATGRFSFDSTAINLTRLTDLTLESVLGVGRTPAAVRPKLARQPPARPPGRAPPAPRDRAPGPRRPRRPSSLLRRRRGRGRSLAPGNMLSPSRRCCTAARDARPRRSSSLLSSDAVSTSTPRRWSDEAAECHGRHSHVLFPRCRRPLGEAAGNAAEAAAAVSTGSTSRRSASRSCFSSKGLDASASTPASRPWPTPSRACCGTGPALFETASGAATKGT